MAAPLGNKNHLGHKHSLESRRQMSEVKKGKHYSPSTEFTSERASEMNKGRVMSAETKLRLSKSKQGQVPWNKGLGTKSRANELARKTKQARLWRIAVYERDNYTCQDCGVRGGELNAHHIKPFSTYPEARYELDNGLTLCVDCHRNTDTWGFRPDVATTNGVFNLASS
jgi:5-methylcytosine-specific restriction endonuclease McrA